MYFPRHLVDKFQRNMLPQIASELTQARAEFGPSSCHRGTITILEDSTKKLVCYMKCADLYYPSACTQQIHFFPISLILEGGVGRKNPNTVSSAQSLQVDSWVFRVICSWSPEGTESNEKNKVPLICLCLQILSYNPHLCSLLVGYSPNLHFRVFPNIPFMLLLTQHIITLPEPTTYKQTKGLSAFLCAFEKPKWLNIENIQIFNNTLITQKETWKFIFPTGSVTHLKRIGWWTATDGF